MLPATDTEITAGITVTSAVQNNNATTTQSTQPPLNGPLETLEDLRRTLEKMHDRCIARNLRAAGLGGLNAPEEDAIYGKLDANALITNGQPLLIATILNFGDPCLQARYVSMLLTEGVDTNAKDEDNMTALLYTCALGYEKTAKQLLRDKAIRVDERDAQGRTALMVAARYGHEKVMRQLLKSLRKREKYYHIDMDLLELTNPQGDTAKAIALQNGHYYCAHLLEEERLRRLQVVSRKLSGLSHNRAAHIISKSRKKQNRHSSVDSDLNGIHLSSDEENLMGNTEFPEDQSRNSHSQFQSTPNLFDSDPNFVSGDGNVNTRQMIAPPPLLPLSGTALQESQKQQESVCEEPSNAGCSTNSGAVLGNVFISVGVKVTASSGRPFYAKSHSEDRKLQQTQDTASSSTKPQLLKKRMGSLSYERNEVTRDELSPLSALPQQHSTGTKKSLTSRILCFIRGGKSKLRFHKSTSEQNISRKHQSFTDILVTESRSDSSGAANDLHYRTLNSSISLTNNSRKSMPTKYLPSEQRNNQANENGLQSSSALPVMGLDKAKLQDLGALARPVGFSQGNSFGGGSQPFSTEKSASGFKLKTSSNPLSQLQQKTTVFTPLKGPHVLDVSMLDQQQFTAQNNNVSLKTSHSSLSWEQHVPLEQQHSLISLNPEGEEISTTINRLGNINITDEPLVDIINFDNLLA